ncbi:MAG: hypothetical protein ACYC9O_08290 [Candidatus Latescibacterota bacterium]
MHLREFLIRQYSKQGWAVCTELLEVNACVEGGWSGTLPDLLMMRGNRKIAVCIESSSDFSGDYLPRKWKSILRNSGVALLVIVRDDYSRDLTLEISERQGIPLECKLIKKSVHRRGKVMDGTMSKRTRLLAVMIVLVLVFITAMLILPSARNSNVPEYYRPHDKERQIDTLKDQLNNLEKK